MAEKTNPLSFIHFVDIETVPELKFNSDFFKPVVAWDMATQEMLELFASKFQHDSNWLRMDPKSCESFYNQKASIHAEFGKVACISVGKLHKDGRFYIKSFCGKDEKKILIDFTEAINGAVMLCAHNGLEFDFPFLFRRYIINSLPIPMILNTMGKKPWEVPLEDTMKLWGATQWNYKCSLALMAHTLGLPSPKQDMDGSKVAEVYYSAFTPEEGELPWEAEERVFKKISAYCEGDVETLANVYCRLKGMEQIKEITFLRPEPKKSED